MKLLFRKKRTYAEKRELALKRSKKRKEFIDFVIKNIRQEVVYKITRGTFHSLDDLHRVIKARIKGLGVLHVDGLCLKTHKKFKQEVVLPMEQTIIQNLMSEKIITIENHPMET